MKQKLIDVLGLLAGFLTTLAFVPQLISVWGNAPKPAADISLPMYAIFCAGVMGWAIYGILIKRWPVILANVGALLFALSILTYKLIYG